MKPHLMSIFKSTIVSPGSHIRLGCSAKGKPRPSISWSRDDREISSSNSLQISEEANTDGSVSSVVQIKNIVTEESGEYKCIAKNAIGNISHHARIQVYGVPNVRPMKNITLVSGQDAAIKCHVIGYPVKHIKWTKGKHFWYLREYSVIQNEYNLGKTTPMAAHTELFIFGDQVHCKDGPRLQDGVYPAGMAVLGGRMGGCSAGKISPRRQDGWLPGAKRVL